MQDTLEGESNTGGETDAETATEDSEGETQDVDNDNEDKEHLE